MLNLKKTLKKKLKGAQKIVVLGVGSELRGDDVAGILVAKELQESCGKETHHSKLKVLIGSTAPENLTGEIKKSEPSHIIIVDSADSGKKAGSVILISPEEVGGVSFSTHMMPLSLMVDYLLRYIKCEIMIIGIQPKTIKFGDSVSKEVAKSVKQVASAIQSVVGS